MSMFLNPFRRSAPTPSATNDIRVINLRAQLHQALARHEAYRAQITHLNKAISRYKNQIARLRSEALALKRVPVEVTGPGYASGSGYGEVNAAVTSQVAGAIPAIDPHVAAFCAVVGIDPRDVYAIGVQESSQLTAASGADLLDRWQEPAVFEVSKVVEDSQLRRKTVRIRQTSDAETTEFLTLARDQGAPIQAWRLKPMTREEATEIAKIAALTLGRNHSYVQEAGDNFEPHEWVVEAILSAVNTKSANDGTWTTLTNPQLHCAPHLYRVRPSVVEAEPAS